LRGVPRDEMANRLQKKGGWGQRKRGQKGVGEKVTLQKEKKGGEGSFNKRDGKGRRWPRGFEGGKTPGLGLEGGGGTKSERTRKACGELGKSKALKAKEKRNWGGKPEVKKKRRGWTLKMAKEKKPVLKGGGKETRGKGGGGGRQPKCKKSPKEKKKVYLWRI